MNAHKLVPVEPTDEMREAFHESYEPQAMETVRRQAEVLQVFEQGGEP